MPDHPFDHPLLSIWLGLVSRCHVPSHPAYRHYGGRGLQVSRRWMSFTNFVSDMGPRPTPQHSVERKDVNLGYGRGNCCWATPTEQNRNTRRTHWITYKGKRQSLPAWAEELGISASTLSTRLQRGWTVEQAFTNPTTKDGYGKRVLQRRTDELCKAAGITRSTFYYRLSKGWTEHDALHTPLRHKRQTLALCAAAGIPFTRFYARIRRGWSEEEALHTPSHQKPARFTAQPK